MDFLAQVPCPRNISSGNYLRCRNKPSECFLESEHNNGNDECSDGSDEDVEWYLTAPRYCYNMFSNAEVCEVFSHLIISVKQLIFYAVFIYFLSAQENMIHRIIVYPLYVFVL